MTTTARTGAVVNIPVGLDPEGHYGVSIPGETLPGPLEGLKSVQEDLNACIARLEMLQSEGWKIMGDDDPNHGSYYYRAGKAFATLEQAVAERKRLGLEDTWMQFGTADDLYDIEDLMDQQ